MEKTVVASFATRRDAEIAVEHLVQKHGIERADIFIRAPRRANTAGVEPAGPTAAEAETAAPDAAGTTADGEAAVTAGGEPATAGADAQAAVPPSPEGGRSQSLR